MKLKNQAEHINLFLSEVYKTPTRLSNILLNQGFSADQLNELRSKHLHQVFKVFLSLIKEGLITQSTIDNRLFIVMIRRFGLDGEPIDTLENIGITFGISRERVRQLERKGLIRLRNSKRRARFEEELKQGVTYILLDEN